jgi:hypothetical protein
VNNRCHQHCRVIDFHGSSPDWGEKVEELCKIASGV